jgi:hypothetical protein
MNRGPETLGGQEQNLGRAERRRAAVSLDEYQETPIEKRPEQWEKLDKADRYPWGNATTEMICSGIEKIDPTQLTPEAARIVEISKKRLAERRASLLERSGLN